MIVYCDFETRSAADLRKTGVYVYADDPTTDVWCMAYSFDGEEPEIWTPDMAPDELLVAHIEAGGALSAFNANFERVIWNKVMAPRYGWPRTKAGQWHCTMALASSKGLPRSLGQVAAVLGLDEQKDKTGQALMMRMARPRKVNDDGTYTWWNTADKVKALIAYCLQDVRTEVAIAEALSEMDGNERQLFLLDQRINDRGVKLDRVLLDKVRVLADTSKAAFDAEIDRLTGGMVSAVTQSTALVAWLRKYGVLTNSVDKQSVAQLLAIEDLHPVIRKVLQLRQDGAKSSTAKLDAMENAAGADDRMRGLLVYHGASTGRWCLAEGSMVLTKKDGIISEIPIESVTVSHQVWDGIEWVSHEGVVFSGDKNVISHDGVVATAEHIVYVSDDESMTLGDAKSKGIPLWRGNQPS